MKRPRHGPRLRDKANPSHYDLCACGFAKCKTARLCLACTRAESVARHTCACGRPRQGDSRRCMACVHEAAREAQTCIDCKGPAYRYALRCRRCNTWWRRSAASRCLDCKVTLARRRILRCLRCWIDHRRRMAGPARTARLRSTVA